MDQLPNRALVFDNAQLNEVALSVSNNAKVATNRGSDDQPFASHGNNVLAATVKWGTGDSIMMDASNGPARAGTYGFQQKGAHNKFGLKALSPRVWMLISRQCDIRV